MPAYKAAQTIEKTYREIPEDSYDKVLVVVDASPDDTVAVAESLGLETRRHPNNRGYGGNQKTCYNWALEEGADVVVLLHPDYQYAPQRVPALIGPVWSKYSNTQRVSSLHLSKGRLKVLSNSAGV